VDATGNPVAGFELGGPAFTLDLEDVAMFLEAHRAH
jgi:hypothetical protein